MSTEYLPVTDAESLDDSLSFFGAEHRIRVNGGHKNRRILIIFRLLGRKSVGVYVDITGKGDMMLIVDNNYFAGEMI